MSSITRSLVRRPPLQSQRLLDLLASYQDILIVMHDNPDPDAIAAGWGLVALVEECQRRTPRLVGGGAIVRAENRRMVELLQPPLEIVDRLDPAPGTGAVLVDCSFGTSNQLLTRHGIRPVAVIDHHEPGAAPDVSVAFNDARDGVAASATIVASYLHEQNIQAGARLATAMVYAMRTETCGFETQYSALDRKMLTWLTEQSEPALLAEIQNAPLSRSYFADLLLAIQNTFLYDDTALCLLPRAEGVEIVGEVADLLIRCQGIHCVLCGAMVGQDLFLSARTSDIGRVQTATTLLQHTVADLGSAGGHTHRAGGKINNAGRQGQIPDALENQLRLRWLEACGVDRQRGTRLVSKREIVDNLNL